MTICAYCHIEPCKDLFVRGLNKTVFSITTIHQFLCLLKRSGPPPAPTDDDERKGESQYWLTFIFLVSGVHLSLHLLHVTEHLIRRRQSSAHQLNISIYYQLVNKTVSYDNNERGLITTNLLRNALFV